MLNLHSNNLYKGLINTRQLSDMEKALYFSTTDDILSAVNSFLESMQIVDDFSISTMIDSLASAGINHFDAVTTLNTLMSHKAAKEMAYASYARVSARHTSKLSVLRQIKVVKREQHFPEHMLHLLHSRHLNHAELTEISLTHYALTEDIKTSLKFLDKAIKNYGTLSGKNYWNFDREIKVTFHNLMENNTNETEYDEDNIRFAARFYAFTHSIKRASWYYTDTWDEEKQTIPQAVIENIFGVKGIAPSLLMQMFDIYFEEELKHIESKLEKVVYF